ncbi:hypothetical protein ACFQ88_23135 [Paenibacillus sp. NPDC056579]|uniref:hypothetical protein n=1 Tax=Paenibacillus sp. NPDC056579 TaxID=3345871 RepID=UPI0036913180
MDECAREKKLSRIKDRGKGKRASSMTVSWSEWRTDLNLYRISQAKKLLLGESLSIADITLKVGYTEFATFNRILVAPLDYDLFPDLGDSYNSNSFVAGILKAAKYEDQDIPVPSKSTPGYDIPVPFYHFNDPVYLDSIPDNKKPSTVTDSVFK